MQVIVSTYTGNWLAVTVFNGKKLCASSIDRDTAIHKLNLKIRGIYAKHS